MSNLQSAIEKAADAFARTIIDAVKGATLQELLGARVAKVPVPAVRRRRGRPPKAAVEALAKPGRKAKAKPGRKPGRPPKAQPVAKKAPKKAAKKAPKKAAKRAKKG